MDIITRPTGKVLYWISELFNGNYFFAILVFAVLVELILLPLAISQHRKSRKQARLRPKEMAIRKKYAGRTDKPTLMKMNEEIQELYQKEGINPMGGCLPLLIQLPLIIAFFQVVNDPLTYISEFSPEALDQIRLIVGPNVDAYGTMGYLNYLTAPDAEVIFANVEGFGTKYIPNLNVFGVLDLSRTPWDCIKNWDTALVTVEGWITAIIPVFTFLSYFFSMKLNKKLSYQPTTETEQSAMGCSPKLMNIVLPLISVYFAFSYAAALGIYWIFKSLVDMLKRFIIAKAMPMPKFTEEDYKEAEREMGVRNEKNSKTTKSGRKVRSLHHIDDEDFEDTAEKARAFKEAYEAQEEEDRKQAEEAQKQSMFGAHKMKDDRRERKNKKGKDESEDAADTEATTEEDSTVDIDLKLEVPEDFVNDSDEENKDNSDN